MIGVWLWATSIFTRNTIVNFGSEYFLLLVYYYIGIYSILFE